uniref:Uncharacterized protein n=1 Tax=Brassica oleracea var. oleracea TaxID=109376 RepID=A0A0D3B7Z9_BRAOL
MRADRYRATSLSNLFLTPLFLFPSAQDSKLCRDLERLGNPSRQASLFIFSLLSYAASLSSLSLSRASLSLSLPSLSLSSPSHALSLSSPAPCSGGGDQISISSPLPLVSRSRSRLRWSVLNPSCSHSTSHEWFEIKARMLGRMNAKMIDDIEVELECNDCK